MFFFFFVHLKTSLIRIYQTYGSILNLVKAIVIAA
jgi:hypothetical protein